MVGCLTHAFAEAEILAELLDGLGPLDVHTENGEYFFDSPIGSLLALGVVAIVHCTALSALWHCDICHSYMMLMVPPSKVPTPTEIWTVVSSAPSDSWPTLRWLRLPVAPMWLL